MNILAKIFELICKLFGTSAKAEDDGEPVMTETEAEDILASVDDPIDLVAEGHCEELTCKKCGKEYFSSGLHDIGICKECLEKENLIGGPLGR